MHIQTGRGRAKGKNRGDRREIGDAVGCLSSVMSGTIESFFGGEIFLQCCLRFPPPLAHTHTHTLCILCLFLPSLPNFFVMLSVSFPDSSASAAVDVSLQKPQRPSKTPATQTQLPSRTTPRRKRKPVFVLFFSSFAVYPSPVLLHAFFHTDPGLRDVLFPENADYRKCPSSASVVYRVHF